MSEPVSPQDAPPPPPPPLTSTPGRPDQTPGPLTERALPRAQPGTTRTRTGVAWWLVAVAMLLLLLVLIFIIQNLTSVRASFLTTHWTIPLGVDLLLAALLGGLVVFLFGTARVLQLRLLVRRRSKVQRPQ